MTAQPTVYAVSLNAGDEITHPETGQVVRVSDMVVRGINQVHVYCVSLSGEATRGFFAPSDKRVTIHNL